MCFSMGYQNIVEDFSGLDTIEFVCGGGGRCGFILS